MPAAAAPPAWIRPIQWAVVFSLCVYFRLTHHVTISGRAHVPWRSKQAMVITATHASYLDPLLVSVALFPLSISYMAKQELFGWTPMGLFVWSMGTFPVNRQKVAKSTIQTALSVLKSKVWHLGIFPQGGRRQGVESIGALKAGAAFFSRKAQAPILPLVVCQSPDNPRRLHVAIGALIDPQGNTEEIALRLQARLNDLLLQAQEKIATDAKS